MIGGFFGKLRELAVTVEKEVKQLERAVRREDAGKSGPHAGPEGLAAAPPCGISAPTCHCPPCSSGSAWGGPGGQPGNCSAGNCLGSSSSRCLAELLCVWVAAFFITEENRMTEMK